MAIIARWRRADTVLEFEEAVRSRRHDAECLRRGRRGYWAVYTRGYMAEMLLKSAYFRFMGSSPAVGLALQMSRAKLQSRARQVGATRVAQNLHDLLFWADLLVYERAFQKKPLSVALANLLMSQVQKVAVNWTETMRYWRSTSAPEAKAVEGAVQWLASNHRLLWS